MQAMDNSMKIVGVNGHRLSNKSETGSVAERAGF